jgi:hypothetical protein
LELELEEEVDAAEEEAANASHVEMSSRRAPSEPQRGAYDSIALTTADADDPDVEAAEEESRRAQVAELQLALHQPHSLAPLTPTIPLSLDRSGSLSSGGSSTHT